MKLIYRLGIKKPKVGIALSGGSTHGAAHIGVLKVLEREGVKVDMIAGTSAGALVGCAYAAGIPLDEISEIFKKMSWPQLLRPSLIRPLSLFDTSPLENFYGKRLATANSRTLTSHLLQSLLTL